MQFNKSVIYQGEKKEFTWGDFNDWSEIARLGNGRWERVELYFGFVKLPYSFKNLIGRKFVSVFELLYENLNFRPNVLYRVYERLDRKWMYISNVLLLFFEQTLCKFSFFSSLFSSLKTKFNFFSSLSSFVKLNVNFVSSLVCFHKLWFNFVSSLFLLSQKQIKFSSSLQSDRKSFKFYSIFILDKDRWASFNVWKEMDIAKNGTWGG